MIKKEKVNKTTMKKKTHKFDSDNIVENILRVVIKKFKNTEWPDKCSAIFKEGKDTIGKITMKDKEMTYEGEKIIKEVDTLIKKYKEYNEKHKITSEAAKKSVFSEKLVSDPDKFNGLLKNPI